MPDRLKRPFNSSRSSRADQRLRTTSAALDCSHASHARNSRTAYAKCLSAQGGHDGPRSPNRLHSWSSCRKLCLRPRSKTYRMGPSPSGCHACSPRPLTVSPFSVSAVCFVMLTASECRSSTFFATMTPFTLYQGPLPIRSRAFTPGSPPGSVVLRYARQLVRVEPAALASERQCASAPSSPPKSAPLPLPTLVTKKVIGAC